MNGSLVIACLLALLTIQAAVPDASVGVTARLVGFDEMVRESSVIVQGRVLKLESVWSGGSGVPGAPEGAKTSRPPAVRPGTASRPEPATVPSPPVGVGTRGGRMIFTLVTLEVIVPVRGSPGKVIEFFVAGGAVDGRAAVVPGMPKFEVGGTYLLFLRNGYWEVGDPIVGVNQGFFRVVQDAQSGREVLLSADSDYVLAIENDRITTRHNPQRSGSHPHPQLTGPPVADRSGVQGHLSAEVQRYWYSTEPLMTVGEFVNAIRSRARP
jgi:hypothetical protein